MSLNLSSAPFAYFSGSTGRMSMVSVTVLFVEFRVLKSLSRATA